MDAELALQIGWRQARAYVGLSLLLVATVAIPFAVIGILTMTVFTALGADGLSAATLLGATLTWVDLVLKLLLLVLTITSPLAALTGAGLGVWTWLAGTQFDPFTIRQQLRWRAFVLGVLATWVLVLLMSLITWQLGDLSLWLFATSGIALLAAVLSVAAVDNVADWYQRTVPPRKRKPAVV